MGWLIAIGVIILLAILPLGVSVRYDEAGAVVKVIAGPVKITLFPRPKKEKKPKKPKKEKKAKEPKAAKEKKPKKEKPKKEKYHPAVNVALLEAADAEAAAKEAKEAAEKAAEIKTANSVNDCEQPDNAKESENKIEKIIFKIQGIYDKINKIIAKIDYYLDVLEEDETQGLIKDAWKSILKILNSIKPKVFRLNAVVGLTIF